MLAQRNELLTVTDVDREPQKSKARSHRVEMLK
jgi:hypothetical protein